MILKTDGSHQGKGRQSWPSGPPAVSDRKTIARGRMDVVANNSGHRLFISASLRHLQISYARRVTRSNAWIVLVIAGWLAGCSQATTLANECVRGADCAPDRICHVGACVDAVSCATSRTCPGQVCATALGVCVDCLRDIDCADGLACIDFVCAMPLDAGESDGGTDAASPDGGTDAASFDAGSDAATFDAGTDAASSDVGTDAAFADAGACLSWALGGVGLPAGTTVTSPASASPVTQAIDGDLTTGWNGGDYVGSITFSFPAPTAIGGVAIAAGSSPDTNEDYTVLAEDGTTVLGTGTFAVRGVATGAPSPRVGAIALTPGTHTSITMQVRGHASWVYIAEASLTTAACP